jgi:cytoskeleton protein RodZ
MASSQKELIPMRAGDLLRSRREKVGLSLERAAEIARLKPSVLAAIESDETAAIPSVYLRGYIRTYARALGLEPADIEEQLAQVQGAEPAVQSVFSVNTGRGRTERWIKASSYLAASAVIAALAWQFTHEAVRFSQGDSELSQAATAASAEAERGSEEPSQQTRPANTHLNASIAAVEVMRPRGERGGKAAAEQAWAAISGQEDGAGAAPPTGEHRLIVSTSADSWVEIFDGQGAQLELDLIRAGHQRSYSGTGPFRVMLGRASAVELTLDGEPVDLAPHTRGNVARLTLEAAAEAGSGEAPDSGNR